MALFVTTKYVPVVISTLLETVFNHKSSSVRDELIWVQLRLSTLKWTDSLTNRLRITRQEWKVTK